MTNNNQDKTTLQQCEDLFKEGIINPSPCMNCGSVQCAICSAELQKSDIKWRPVSVCEQREENIIKEINTMINVLSLGDGIKVDGVLYTANLSHIYILKLIKNFINSQSNKESETK